MASSWASFLFKSFAFLNGETRKAAFIVIKLAEPFWTTIFNGVRVFIQAPWSFNITFNVANRPGWAFVTCFANQSGFTVALSSFLIALITS